MKPQTFEEWLETRPSLSALERMVAGMVWLDAHENAAMVCDALSDSECTDGGRIYTDRGLIISDCADAIREQGRK